MKTTYIEYFVKLIFSIVMAMLVAFHVGCSLNNAIEANFSALQPDEGNDLPPTDPPPSDPPPPDPPMVFDFIDLPSFLSSSLAESDIVQVSGISSNQSIAISGLGGSEPWNIQFMRQGSPPLLLVNSEDSEPISFKFSGDGSKMYMLGRATGAIYQYSLATAFNVYTAVYDMISFPINGQDASPYSLNFNPSGTKMFMTGSSNDKIYQYTLTAGFDLTTASYDSVNYSFAGQDTSPRSVAFNSDGSKMYMFGELNDTIYEYSLPTPYDINTVNNFSISMSLATYETTPRSMLFNDDGTKMYTLGTGSDSIMEFSLSPGFDITTAVYSGNLIDSKDFDEEASDIAFNLDGSRLSILGRESKQFFEVRLPSSYELPYAAYQGISAAIDGQDITPKTYIFNDDGSMAYVVGDDSDSIYQYSLSTNYNIGVFSYTGDFLDVSTEDLTPIAIVFNTDGTKLFVAGNGSNTIYEYDLSTPYLVSSGVYNSKSIDISGQDTAPQAISFNPSGSRMYMVGSGSDEFHQYDLSVAFDLSSAVYNSVLFSVRSQDKNPRAMVFDNTGLKLYMAGNSTDSLYEYSLTLPFDISTLSFKALVFRFDNEDSSPDDLVFNGDGSKLYMTGTLSDKVYEYTLPSAYMLPKSPHEQTQLSMYQGDDIAQSIAFSDDGLKMFMIGKGTNFVHEYNLSIAHTPSSASYSSVTLDVSGKEGAAQALVFNNDGTKLFVTGATSQAVHEYDLPQAYDLALGTFVASFSMALEDLLPYSLAFNNDGSKMFMLGSTNDRIYEYLLSSNYDVTSAVINTSFSVFAIDSSARSIRFNSDGTKLFYLGAASDRIYQFSLAVAFDASTISNDYINFSVKKEDADPESIVFSSDGQLLYYLGGNSNTVYTYHIGDGGQPEYRICADVMCSSELFGWRSDGTGTVNNNDFIQLRILSPNLPSITSETTINIGGNAATANWILTTQP